MPRACTVCKHPQRAAIDLAILAAGPGMGSVIEVSRKYRIGDSSVRRHASRHLATTLLRELRANDSLQTADLLQVLVELLDDAAAVRQQALLSGQAALLLRAGAQSRDLVTTLINTLGIEDRTVVTQLADSERLARTVGNVARRRPDLARILAEDLDEHGASELADELRATAQVTSRALLEGTYAGG